MAIDIMGKFTAIGHTTRAPAGGTVIETCSHNDGRDAGNDLNWSWANPTNRRFSANFVGVGAVSVEALWQGLKSLPGQPCPDYRTLAGDWRRGKKACPAGHWSGKGQPLITGAGEARRRIYLPAYASQIDRWLRHDLAVADHLASVRAAPGLVFLRDWDTGRGIDDAVDDRGRHHGPMSHAWALRLAQHRRLARRRSGVASDLALRGSLMSSLLSGKAPRHILEGSPYATRRVSDLVREAAMVYIEAPIGIGFAWPRCPLCGGLLDWAGSTNERTTILYRAHTTARCEVRRDILRAELLGVLAGRGAAPPYNWIAYDDERFTQTARRGDEVLLRSAEGESAWWTAETREERGIYETRDAYEFFVAAINGESTNTYLHCILRDADMLAELPRLLGDFGRWVAREYPPEASGWSLPLSFSGRGRLCRAAPLRT